jgi:hypothetical protein
MFACSWLFETIKRLKNIILVWNVLKVKGLLWEGAW